MSELKLFNTLTREKETFVPLVPGEVRMYSCGPTVYSHPHIGNMRTFLWSDLLRRYLEWRGYKVTHVMNITDVDDRIIQNANAAGQDIYTYTAPYITSFHESLRELRIRPADAYPRATQYIPQMVRLVERLDKSDAEPSWQTALGEGRPGWHLECSAMSMELLGESFDIHTGAVDLIFPHHENEIAQSEGATAKPFVRTWVHGEHLNIDQQKMSKSLGNIYTLAEVKEMRFDPLVLRYALLSVPHRTKLNFTEQSLIDARSALERIELFMLRLEEISRSAPHDAQHSDGHADQLIGKFITDFEAAMDDDLNTAGALGALFTLIREANVAIDAGRITSSDAEGICTAMLRVHPVLDIYPRRDESLDATVRKLIDARNAARKSRNFTESDRIRDELLGRGIIIEDTPGGTRWRRK